MAIRHGKNAKAYFKGIDISGDVNNIGGRMVNEHAAYAVYGNEGYSHVAGLAADEVTIEALLDTTLEVPLTALFNDATTGYGMMILYGTTVGDAASAVNGIKVKSYEWKSVVTDINKLTADFVAENYPFDSCKLLQPASQKIADGTGTILDNLASSADGAVGYVQVIEQTGGTGVTLSIRHSTDNFVANDTELLTFGNFAAAGTSRVAATGTVNRYMRAKWVFAGGGPYTATFVIVLKRI